MIYFIYDTIIFVFLRLDCITCCVLNKYLCKKIATKFNCDILLYKNDHYAQIWIVEIMIF